MEFPFSAFRPSVPFRCFSCALFCVCVCAMALLFYSIFDERASKMWKENINKATAKGINSIPLFGACSIVSSMVSCWQPMCIPYDFQSKPDLLCSLRAHFYRHLLTQRKGHKAECTL